MTKPRMCNIEFIKLQAEPGAEVTSCLRDAAVLAINEWVKVIVVHNGVEYMADPKKIAETITDNF